LRFSAAVYIGLRTALGHSTFSEGRRHSIIFITLLRLLLVVLRVVPFVSTAASFWISDFDGKCIPTRQIARLVVDIINYKVPSVL